MHDDLHLGLLPFPVEQTGNQHGKDYPQAGDMHTAKGSNTCQGNKVTQLMAYNIPLVVRESLQGCGDPRHNCQAPFLEDLCCCDHGGDGHTQGRKVHLAMLIQEPLCQVDVAHGLPGAGDQDPAQDRSHCTQCCEGSNGPSHLKKRHNHLPLPPPISINLWQRLWQVVIAVHEVNLQRTWRGDPVTLLAPMTPLQLHHDGCSVMRQGVPLGQAPYTQYLSRMIMSAKGRRELTRCLGSHRCRFED